jgi:hypothetical protein
MPNTPKIVTRQETTSSNTTENLNKGSKLTFAEMDSNFIELRNGSIGIVGDDSTGIDIAHGSTLKVAGTGGIATSVSGDTLTIDASSITTSSLGDLTAVGSTLISPTNADITLDPSGTGSVSINADLSMPAIEIHDNNIKATRTNDDLVLETNNTGIVKVRSDLQVGLDNATGRDDITIKTGTNSRLQLQATGGVGGAGSQSASINIEPGSGNGTGEKGDIHFNLGENSVGSVSGKAIFGNTSNFESVILTTDGAKNLILNTNEGTNSGSISIVDGTAGQISVHTSGHGNISIGSNSGTGDGTAFTKIEGSYFRNHSSGAGTWFEMPMSIDGSTISDVEFNMRSDGAPELYFNNTGSAAGRFRVGTGALTISAEGSNSSSGDIRIEAAGTLTLDAATINLGGDTIVVSGNRMHTDDSNEDLELEANGTGNISLLSPANMNSNKITNVTDPTANQDAATKAYVDAQVLASGDTGDLTINGSTITAPSNADLTLTTSGTGDIVLSDNVDASGSTITADDFIGDLNGTVRFEGINRSGGTISKGQVVYISGISGNTPEIGLARANSSSTMPGFGLAQADINDDATGEIATFGSLTGLDVADFGETAITFGLGDTVYISSAESGKLTNVPPTGESNSIQNIGKIERATPTTNMTIKVGGAGRSNATPALDEGNIFIGNASNQSVTTNLQTQVEAYSINNVVEDTTPQLGGDLDAQTNNITNLGTLNTHTVPGGTGTIALTSDITFTPSSSDTLTNKTFDANGTGNSITNIETADIAAGTLVTAAEGIGSNNNDTTIPTSAAVKAYADSVGGGGSATGLTFVGDDSTGTLISDGETVKIAGGTGITTAMSGDTLTITASGSANTGDIVFDGNNMSTGSSNADFEIESSGTGKILLQPNGAPDLSAGQLETWTTSDYRVAGATHITDVITGITPGNREYKYDSTFFKTDGTDSASGSARFRKINQVVLDLNGSELTATGGSRGLQIQDAILSVNSDTVNTAVVGTHGGHSIWSVVGNDGTANFDGSITATDAYGFRVSTATVTNNASTTTSVTNAYGVSVGHSQYGPGTETTNNYTAFNYSGGGNAATNTPYLLKTSDDKMKTRPGALEKFNEWSYTATHSSGSTYTVDWANGNLQTVTLTSNITGFTMSNFPTDSNQSVGVTLYLVQDGTGSRSMTFTAASGETFKFANGVNSSSVSSANDIQTVYIFSRYNGSSNTFYWTLGPTYS